MTITEKMEKAYRLCHHDFSGYSRARAAIIMGISKSTLNRLLAKMKRGAPQLFPILTREQADLWHLWYEQGLTCKAIAAIRDTTERSIQSKITILKRKLKFNSELHRKPDERPVSYETLSEDEKAGIKRKF